MNKKLAASLLALGLAGGVYADSISYTGSSAFFTPPLDSGDLLNAFGSPFSVAVSKWNPALFPAGAVLVLRQPQSVPARGARVPRQRLRGHRGAL